MKDVLIGCPYTDLSNIEASLKLLGKQEINVYQARDVVAINNGNNVEINGSQINVDEFSCTFLRYPYDLISPHSATYSKREETEFYKSLCLLFDHININSLQATWSLRNRLNSLIQLRSFGASVPDFQLLKKGGTLNFNERCAAKAVGNCYVSEIRHDVEDNQEAFLSFEQDGDDFAAVFPASQFSTEQAIRYIDAFGTAFLQASVESLHVPAHSDHPFRFNPITDFGLIRSPISELSDQK